MCQHACSAAIRIIQLYFYIKINRFTIALSISLFYYSWARKVYYIHWQDIRFTSHEHMAPSPAILSFAVP